MRIIKQQITKKTEQLVIDHIYILKEMNESMAQNDENEEDNTDNRPARDKLFQHVW